MLKIAFITAIIGLGLLVALLLKEPVFVETLDGLVVGEVISIKGIVDEERKFGSGKLLIVGDILVFCECSKNYIGLNVVVSGVIERFPEDLRVRAFSVKVIS
ncbi:hypothetical protein J4423_05195 [Candidatus Pacearchaeota archaeon]|nr:hypothetical protein [Candidatus Pacearchaeota archaeon]